MYLFLFQAKDDHHVSLVIARNKREAWRQLQITADYDTGKYPTVTAVKKDYRFTALQIPDKAAYLAFFADQIDFPGRIECIPNAELEKHFPMTKKEESEFLAELRSKK